MANEIVFGRNDSFYGKDLKETFVDFINETFEEIQSNTESQIRTGTRTIRDLECIVKGGWLMFGCGFDYKFRIEDCPDESMGEDMLTFAIWPAGENEKGKEPKYAWHAILFR